SSICSTIAPATRRRTPGSGGVTPPSCWSRAAPSAASSSATPRPSTRPWPSGGAPPPRRPRRRGAAPPPPLPPPPPPPPRRPARRRGAAAGAAVRRLVWDRLAAHFPEGIKTVFVCPDGGLGELPFAALPARQDGRLLAEEVSVRLVPYGPALSDWLQGPRP